MTRSHTLLRRYTPPTCTLEIMAKESPLSRWAAKPVTQELRFRLSLDDPKLDRDDWITIQGDRTQLSALGEAVAQYVQQVLDMAPDRLGLTLAEVGTPTAIAPPEIAPPEMMPPAISPTDSAPPTAAFGIWLHPKGLLSHALHWGDLATPETGEVTILSTVQLFDLANALDDFAEEVLDLPDRDRRPWRTSVPNWAQVAAVVLVAIGLSTSALRLVEGGNLVATAPTSSQGASSRDQQLATQLPPELVERATPPVISTETLPSLPSPTATATPKVTVPAVPLPQQSPSPSAAPGTLPSVTVPGDAIATYPVPAVPGAPIVVPEVRSQPESAIASAPAARSDRTTAGTYNAAEGAPRPSADSGNSATAFDSIPQVAEARSYFEQRWQPPDGLTQILEYSIQVSGDGTVERITPLRQASGDFIDRTGMPLVGDPFVSPLKDKPNAKIRVVLEPSGQVRTFLEP